MTSHTYKLTYFDVRGRAEIIRLLFVAAQVEFEDVRLELEDIHALKPTLPFGQLPILEIDGEVCAQSHVIAVYLAKEFGLYGRSILDGLKIEQVVCHMEDVRPMLLPMFREKDADKKKELATVLKEKRLVDFIGYLERIYEKSTGDFLINDEMTLADMIVYETMTYLEYHLGFESRRFPRISHTMDKVHNHPELASYLKNRKTDAKLSKWIAQEANPNHK